MHNCGIPHKRKRFSRQLITVEEYMLGHGKTNGNLEYSSIITNKYLLRDELGGGPLKSILIRSNGFDALMALFSFVKGWLEFSTNATRGADFTDITCRKG